METPISRFSRVITRSGVGECSATVCSRVRVIAINTAANAPGPDVVQTADASGAENRVAVQVPLPEIENTVLVKTKGKTE